MTHAFIRHLPRIIIGILGTQHLAQFETYRCLIYITHQEVKVLLKQGIDLLETGKLEQVRAEARPTWLAPAASQAPR